MLKTGDTQTALEESINITKIKPTKNDLDKIVNAAYPSRFDGKKMGCSSDVVLEKTFPNYEKPEKSFARYSTSIKNNDNDIKISVYVPLNNKKINGIEESIKTAKYAATNKNFEKELKTKTEVMRNQGVNEKDISAIMKNAKIWWADVRQDGNGNIGIRSLDSKGKKQYLEAQFITLPNGKIIPTGPYINDLD